MLADRKIAVIFICNTKLPRAISQNACNVDKSIPLLPAKSSFMLDVQLDYTKLGQIMLKFVLSWNLNLNEYFHYINYMDMLIDD